MCYLTQLYSELKSSKKEIYEDYACLSNVSNFVKHLENKAFPKEVFDNLYWIFFNNNGNGHSLYGKKSFSLHFNLLFFDKESVNWYILDYDIENILDNCLLDQPILCPDFLQLAFCTKPAEEQITLAIEENNYYPLQSFQQVMIFSYQEFNTLNNKYPDFIHKLRFLSLEPEKKEENFLWELYSMFNVSFNNLYEFILFLKEKNPCIDRLRFNYQNKTFETISFEGFANAQYRLDKEKLLALKDFIFNAPKSTKLELVGHKTTSGYSNFFTPMPEKQTADPDELQFNANTLQ